MATYQVGASTDDAWRGLTPSQWSLTRTQLDAGAGSSASKLGSGMRFTNIILPQGAVIERAYLTLWGVNSSGVTVNTRISAEDVDNAATFADDSAAFDTRWAARTTARVDWDAIPAWAAGGNYDSPEIKTVIQEIVDRTGWASGNAIVIFWDDFDDRSSHLASASRAGKSYDGDSTNAPKLTIGYAMPQTIKRFVAVSSDDCYRYLTPTGGWSLTEASFVAGAFSGTSYQFGSGARFAIIPIPQRATIDEAYLRFRAGASDAGTVVNTRISAEDVDNAATFADDSAAFDTRWAARTTARVDWDSISAWTAGEYYNSPEIKTVIQEIVDRAGWASGNSIVIFWDDFDDRSSHGADRMRVAESYDGGVGPQLVITYTTRKRRFHFQIIGY